MNKFEQKLRTLIPELAGYKLKTGNAMDYMMKLHNTIVTHNLENPGDGYYLVALTGMYVEREENGQVSVTISNDLEGKLTDEEIRGLALHEVGHLVNDDMSAENTAGAKYLNEADREIAADRHALDNGISKEVLMSAIVKVTQHGVRQLITWARFMSGHEISLEQEENAVSLVETNFPIHEAARYNALVNA